MKGSLARSRLVMRQSEVVAAGRLSLATSTPPHIAPFSAPLHTETGRPTFPKRQAAARARTAKPGANAPARRSKATAAPGRTTGGGGRYGRWLQPTLTTQGVRAGGVTKPKPASQRNTPPPTPRYSRNSIGAALGDGLLRRSSNAVGSFNKWPAKNAVTKVALCPFAESTET